MSDISPILMVFAMFFTSIMLVVAAVIVWGLAQLKRARLASAASQLKNILALAREALKSGSGEKRNELNEQIDQWDKRFRKEIGVELQKLPELEAV